MRHHRLHSRLMRRIGVFPSKFWCTQSNHSFLSIYARAIPAGRLIETMRFISTAVPLVEPLTRATACVRLEKPESKGCRIITFSIDHSSCKVNLPLSSPLIKIPFLRRFKSAGMLKNHLLNGENPFEVKAISPYPVHPHIPNHQHP